MYDSKPRAFHGETGYARRLCGEALLDILFREARAPAAWQRRAVPDEPLRKAVALASMVPTDLNCSPVRVMFIRSSSAKSRLAASLMPADIEKTMAAPVTAIIGFDVASHEQPPRLYPEANLGPWFAGADSMAAVSAFRNGTMQGAYLILAARALGLDCDPITTFDHAGVDVEFFPQSAVSSNLLCNLGYAEPTLIPPHGPRFAFDEIACTV